MYNYKMLFDSLGKTTHPPRNQDSIVYRYFPSFLDFCWLFLTSISIKSKWTFIIHIIVVYTLCC